MMMMKGPLKDEKLRWEIYDECLGRPFVTQGEWPINSLGCNFSPCMPTGEFDLTRRILVFARPLGEFITFYAFGGESVLCRCSCNCCCRWLVLLFAFLLCCAENQPVGDMVVRGALKWEKACGHPGGSP